MMHDTRVETLRSGDQAHLWGHDRDILSIQVDTHSRQVLITTDEPIGEPVDLVGLDGQPERFQPRRTFVYPVGFYVPASTQAEMADAEA